MNGRVDSDFDALLAQCIATIAKGDATLAGLCAKYPDYASELEQRLGALERFGLLDTISTSGRPVRPEHQRFGRYPVLGELGHGAMGSVYLGRDPALDRWVAIKVIACEEDRLARWLPRFEAEARVLAQLQHPHIAIVFALETSGPRPFIVMELVRGRSLRDKIDSDGRIHPRSVLEWGHAMASALDKAHRHGVVHRDLKPSNVVVDPDGIIKVLDFGLAWLDSSDDRVERGFEGVVGTPGYMSPEQVLGDDVDGRSDLFSLGAVLFECASGRPAFAGDSIDERLRLSLEEAPVWRQLPPLDAGFSDLLRACLAKPPSDRPPSAADVRDRLASVLRRYDSPIARRSEAPEKRIGPPLAQPFIGRRAILPAIHDRVLRSRWTTLVGLSGIGKTYCASELAERWFVDDFVERYWIEGTTPTLDGIGDGSGDGRRLVVIDGCEAGQSIATDWDERRERHPELHVLATARAPIGVVGESTIDLRGLEAGDGDPVRARDYDAIEMFLERARAALGDKDWSAQELDIVRELCRRVDGHPLAIEILAGQLAHRTLADLLAGSEELLLGLHHREPRYPWHRSIARAIDASLAALTPEAVRMLEALSIQHGGWDLAAAHDVSGVGGEVEFDTAHAELVAASLVTLERSASGRGRYAMPRIVRAFCRRRLRATEAFATVAARHRAYYDRWLAERASSDASDTQFDEIEVEHASGLAAIESSIDTGDLERAMRLIDSLSRFWSARGYWREGCHCCERLLGALAERPEAAGARSRVASTLGSLRLLLGDYESARRALEMALTHQREHGDATEMRHTLNNLARADLFLGEYDRAEERLDESLALADSPARTDADDDRATTLALFANAAQMRGQLEEAAQRFETCLANAERCGNDYLVAASLHNLADLAMQTGALDLAEDYYERAIAINRRRSNREFLGRNLAALAALLRRRSQYDRARALFLEAFDIQLDLGDRDAIVRLLLSIALFASEIGAHRLCVEFVAAAEARGDGVIETLPTEARDRLDASREAARVALGEKGYRSASDRGARASLRRLARALRDE